VCRHFSYFLLVLVVPVTLAYSDEASGPPPDGEPVSEITVEDTIHFSRPIPGHWTAEIEGVSLPAGSLCLVRVKLVNDSDQVLHVIGGKTTCGCTKATLDPDEWEAHEEATLSIHIKTPSTGDTARFNTGMLFEATTPEGPVKLNIGFNCKLNGMLSFKDKLYPLSLGSDDSPETFRIPFVSTIVAPDFELDFDGEFVFDDTSIAPGEETSQLLLTVAPGLVPKSGAFGKLTIRDKKSRLEDTVDIIIEHPKKIAISPYTMRFSATDASDEVVAGAIVRLSSDPEVAKNKPVLIEAYVDGKRVNTKSQRLSDRVYRVHLTTSAETFDRTADVSTGIMARKSIDWRIMFNGENLTLSSPAIVKAQRD
jgi:hypothetical protein